MRLMPTSLRRSARGDRCGVTMDALRTVAVAEGEESAFEPGVGACVVRIDGQRAAIREHGARRLIAMRVQVAEGEPGGGEIGTEGGGAIELGDGIVVLGLSMQRERELDMQAGARRIRIQCAPQERDRIVIMTAPACSESEPSESERARRLALQNRPARLFERGPLLLIRLRIREVEQRLELGRLRGGERLLESREEARVAVLNGGHQAEQG